MANQLDAFIQAALQAFPAARFTEGPFLKALFLAYSEVELTVPTEQTAEIGTQMNVLRGWFPVGAAHTGVSMNIAENLTAQLKLIALKALPAIEQKAIAFAKETHQKMAGKRGAAVDYVMQQYGAIEASIPGLKDTTLDNDLLRAQAGAAVDWAWGELGDVINALGRQAAQPTPAQPAPVNNDPTLPPTKEETA